MLGREEEAGSGSISLEAGGGSSAENPMNDFGEVPHLSAAVPVRTGLNRLIRK